MLLRICGNGNLEIGDPAQARDQFGRIGIAARMRLVGRADAARRVAPKRDEVLHADRLEFRDDGMHLLPRRPDAGQVRGGRQAHLQELAHGRQRRRLGGTAGAIGDRHEARRIGRELGGRFPELAFGLRRLGREEFEGQTDILAGWDGGRRLHVNSSCGSR